MVTIHKPRALHAAIIARIASETGKDAEIGRRPAGASTPYVVLYPLPDGDVAGAVSDPRQYVWQTFQLFYVGDDADEAQWMQEQTHTALLGWRPTVAGFQASPIELDTPNLFGETDFDGPVFPLADRFRVNTS